jgi:hypothetical protein
MAGNLKASNAVVDRHQRTGCTVKDRFHVSRLPPHGPLCQQAVGECPRALPFRRISQLLVATKDNDTHPLLRAHYFGRFDADPRVGAHPLDLLADRGKAIQVVILVSEIEWHDVRLGPLSARQPAETRTSQQIQTRFPSQFLNQHGLSTSRPLGSVGSDENHAPSRRSGIASARSEPSRRIGTCSCIEAPWPPDRRRRRCLEVHTGCRRGCGRDRLPSADLSVSLPLDLQLWVWQG